MKTTWTILIDEREKKPLPFPDHLSVMDHGSSASNPRLTTVMLRTKKATLKTGDYVLEGHESAGCIERKQHLVELHGNLCTTEGRTRFLKELDRFREYSHPCIVLESPSPDKRHPHPDVKYSPTAVRDMLLMVCVSRKIPLLTFTCTTDSQRRLCAEWTASFLIQAAISSSIGSTTLETGNEQP